MVSRRSNRRSTDRRSGRHGFSAPVTCPTGFRRLDRPALLALALFAAVYAALSAFSSAQTAAAWDEPTHLAAGYAELSQADYRFDPAHPPLLRMWAALPLLAMPDVSMQRGAADKETPDAWLSAVYPFARRFLYRENDGDRLLQAGRWMTQCLALLLAAFVFLWVREWLGLGAATFALVVFALEPNLLAHATVITTDLGVTCFIVGALYFAWRLHRHGGAVDLAGLVACVALAVASKFSAVLLAPILAVLWLVTTTDRSVRAWRRLAALAALTGGVTWAAVWAVYGFRYLPSATAGWAFALPGAFQGDTPSLVARVIAAIDRHHMLPNAFAYGLLDAYGSTSRLNAYLAGQYSDEGWWYYFPVAVLAKAPTSFIVLVVIGAVLIVRRRRDLGVTNLAYVLVPLAGFGLAAAASGINIGVRHVLPIYPLLILVAAVGERAFRDLGRRLAIPALCGLGVLWAGELGAAYPYPLTFFNLVAGGPANGHQWLADSNLGWGQGLKSLKEWMVEHKVDHVNLAYFGQADPGYYRIDFTALPSSGFSDMDFFSPPQLPGYVAISATTLTGVHLPPELRLLFAPFRSWKPEAVVANSIRVYRVDVWPVADEPSDAGSGMLRLRLADALLYGSRWPAGAVPQYEVYLRSHAPDAAVLVGYGTALLQSDRPADGLAALRRAIGMDPAAGAAHLVLAQALFLNRDFQGAREHAEAALALRPRDPEASYLMARIRLDDGERILALRFLRQTLELDPAHTAARELMAAMAVAPAYHPGNRARASHGR